MHERHLRFPTVFNFRDLGGYRAADGRTVRWRQVFRADGVHRLSAADLAAHGVRTVVDLRTLEEREELGHFAHERVASHHLPMMHQTWETAGVLPDHDAAAYLADRYLDMLDTGARAIAGALELMAEPRSLPLVFHCAAGKDRTGVLAALLLATLGVDDAAIAKDYALSTLATQRWTAWVSAERPDLLERTASLPTQFMASPAAAIERFLALVRQRHGSTDAYLARIGVERDVVQALRRTLLV